MKAQRVVIMGAAGRDFHNFNASFRPNKQVEVVALTTTQIPNIEDRHYPSELAHDDYPEGVPIYPEHKLSQLIRDYQVSRMVFSYSDIPHEYVMHKASEVLTAGADFRLLELRITSLPNPSDTSFKLLECLPWRTSSRSVSDRDSRGNCENAI